MLSSEKNFTNPRKAIIGIFPFNRVEARCLLTPRYLFKVLADSRSHYSCGVLISNVHGYIKPANKTFFCLFRIIGYIFYLERYVRI